MRCALISDIHANLEALQTVFRDIDEQHLDRVHCLGDVIGYGCNPVECLNLVVRHCDIKLLGNHEYVALGLLDWSHLNKVARDSMAWTVSQLDDRELAQLADFELDATIHGAYLVHASPRQPDQWHYIMTISEAKGSFECFPQQTAFFGHSHVPHIYSAYPDGTYGSKVGHDFNPDPEGRYLVNVGSVGQPRDNDPRSSYVIYDSKQQEIIFRRVEYDVGLTQKKMKEASIHKMLADRLVVGR
ncbi:MAG TPA: metallophosphoesterase family protein [Acidobacteriota bacterium]|nr:metallophosphoesterase family protein [Acidobacteriota bacterium]